MASFSRRRRWLPCIVVIGSLLLTALSMLPESSATTIPVRQNRGPVWNVPVTSPDLAVQAALFDLENHVPAVERPYIRYLSLHNFAHDAAEVDVMVRLCRFVINSLSRAGSPQPVLKVAGTGDTLLRLNISDFRWKRDVWEKLGRQDPYFHADGDRTDVAIVPQTKTTVATVEVEEEYQQYWPGGTDKEGKYFPAGNYTYKRKVKKPVVQEQAAPSVAVPVAQQPARVHGLDLHPDKVERLGLLTVSDAPILRGDWFIATTFRPPFYYEFLGIPEKEEDFIKNVVFANPEQAAQAEKDRRGTVTASGITINNRRLDRVPTFLGYYWFSTDAKTSVDAQNFLEILLDRKKENFDASEQIFSLPNELQGYALFNNKGIRQDAVPDDIASSNQHSHHDGRILAGVSCTICHNVGILPFRSVIRDIVKKPTRTQGGGKLESPDPESIRRAQQLYSDADDMLRKTQRDQQLYNDAVKKVTGWDGSKLSLNLNRIYSNYLYGNEPGRDPLTLEMAAREMGVTVAHAREKLAGMERPGIIGLLNDVPLRRDQWEKLYPEAAARCSAYTKKEKKP